MSVPNLNLSLDEIIKLKHEKKRDERHERKPFKSGGGKQPFNTKRQFRGGSYKVQLRLWSIILGRKKE